VLDHSLSTSSSSCPTRVKAIILICGDLAMARKRSSGSSKESLIQRPFTGGSEPKAMVRSMNFTRRQSPLAPGTTFHRGHEWNIIRDTMPPMYSTLTVIPSRSSIKVSNGTSHRRKRAMHQAGHRKISLPEKPSADFESDPAESDSACPG
jgi:hypothetical protein